MDYFSAFDVDAAAQHDEQKAARHASILFNQRATERFEGFLRGAAHKDEFEARYALVHSDILKVASELTAGPHPLVDAFIGRIAGGAFCDDCRKWKSGPKSLCSCGSDEDNGDGALSDDTSAVGDKESKVSFRVIATGEDSLGGKGVPSPKIDKSNAGDERSNKKRAPIDTDSGRYKTVHQDVADSADYGNRDFLEQTETVTDHDVDVSKKHDIKGTHTDTWSGKGGQADPVTSSTVVSAESTCPECSATTFDGVCSNSDCAKSHTDDNNLHPKEYGGPRDPQVKSHFLSDEEVTRAIDAK